MNYSSGPGSILHGSRKFLTLFFFSLNHPLLFFPLGLRAEVEALLALPVLVPLNARSEQRKGLDLA